MADEKKKIDGLELGDDGYFIKWKKIFELVSEATPNTVVGSAPSVPGLNITDVLKPYSGKKIRIVIEVLETY